MSSPLLLLFPLVFVGVLNGRVLVFAAARREPLLVRVPCAYLLQADEVRELVVPLYEVSEMGRIGTRRDAWSDFCDGAGFAPRELEKGLDVPRQDTGQTVLCCIVCPRGQCHSRGGVSLVLVVVSTWQPASASLRERLFIGRFTDASK